MQHNKRYGRFSIFQDGGCLPSCIFKSLEFLAAGTVRGGAICIILSNFVSLGQTVAEIWRFFVAAFAILDF